MVNEERVKLMTRLAAYEENEGREDFKISEYYRKDYASMKTVISVLWMTVGYVLIIALAGVAFFEKLMEKLSMEMIAMLGIAVGAGYLILLIVYVIISKDFYNKKHTKARQRVKKYNHDLLRLMKMYEKEER